MRLLSAFVVVLLGMSGAAFASETVIVPYDATKPIAGQKPDQFYLPYERFLELWEAAKMNRTGARAEPAVVAYVLSAARYDGVVGERSVSKFCRSRCAATPPSKRSAGLFSTPPELTG